MESGGLTGCDLVCDGPAVGAGVLVARRRVEAEQLVSAVERADVRLRGLVVAALDSRGEGAEHELDALEVDVQRVASKGLAFLGCIRDLLHHELVSPLARDAKSLADHGESVAFDVKLQRGLACCRDLLFPRGALAALHRQEPCASSASTSTPTRRA